MKTVTFTEFRKNASGVLDLVEKGESIRVLRHGKAVARIIPAEPRETKPAWKRPGLRLVTLDQDFKAFEAQGLDCLCVAK